MSCETAVCAGGPAIGPRILIVDDHPIVREGLAQFLNLQGRFHPCCEASCSREALAAMATCGHELAIVDISLEGESGLELIRQLHQKYPALAILAMSMHDESLFAERALRAGAHGYLMKQEATRNILRAVDEVLAGRIYLSATAQSQLTRRLLAPQGREGVTGLSEREFEILHLIGLGFGTSQIAAKLNRSVKTIEAHQARIKDKLQLQNGRELVRFALQWVAGGPEGSD